MTTLVKDRSNLSHPTLCQPKFWGPAMRFGFKWKAWGMHNWVVMLNACSGPPSLLSLQSVLWGGVCQNGVKSLPETSSSSVSTKLLTFTGFLDGIGQRPARLAKFPVDWMISQRFFSQITRELWAFELKNRANIALLIPLLLKQANREAMFTESLSKYKNKGTHLVLHLSILGHMKKKKPRIFIPPRTPPFPQR